MNVSLSPANTFQTSPATDNQAASATPIDAGTTKEAADASLAKLNVNGQIRQLKEQGQTLSQISVDVDLSISAVGNDLLINVPEIPAITQAPQPGAASSFSLSA